MQFLSKSFSAEKISLWFVLLFFICLTFFSSSIPFFWDGDLLSQEAHFYFTNNFSNFILPPALDRDGTPVIYAAYLAAAWKLFGKTLLVSHLALLPFLLGIVWEYFKLTKKFLRPGIIPFAMLLLVFEPTFVMQSIIMGFDIAMLYLFLLALNSLLSANFKLYGLALVLLGFCSVRGIALGISLLMIHFLIRIVVDKKFPAKELGAYIFPVVILFTVSLLHYFKTGWFFISSNPDYAASREFVSLNMMIRQCVYVLWYIGDFGRAFIWLLICGVFIYLYLLKRKTPEVQSKQVIIIAGISILTHIILLSPFSNPVAHRYFLNIILFSMIAVCFALQSLNLNRKILYGVFTFICAGLLTGNFWLYTGGFSNGWDSSLKGIPYFEMRKEIQGFVQIQKINPAEIGTKFPVYQNAKFTDLSDGEFHYKDMGYDSLKNYKYVLLSNISNQFTVKEKKYLNENWIPLLGLQEGQVYMKLFRNPSAVSH